MAECKFCPLMVSGGNMHINGYCIGKDCAWWCEFGNDCAIPLITGNGATIVEGQKYTESSWDMEAF